MLAAYRQTCSQVSQLDEVQQLLGVVVHSLDEPRELMILYSSLMQ